VIGLLVGYIVYATAKRIARVEDDFQEMSLLKKRAEDADIAKSQVISFATNNSYACFVLLFLLEAKGLFFSLSLSLSAIGTKKWYLINSMPFSYAVLGYRFS
jgi:hypothetical protein